jgi:CBS-domain-containing membrane protein
MREGHFRHLPVTDGGRLIGIVSIRDLYQSVVDQMGADIILLAEGLLQG